MGGGVRGTLRGLVHSHVGWILTEQGGDNRAKYARDLIEDPGMTTPPTSSSSPSAPSARPGITTFTPSRAPPNTASSAWRKCGLVSNVVPITPERQREKTLVL